MFIHMLYEIYYVQNTSDSEFKIIPLVVFTF